MNNENPTPDYIIVGLTGSIGSGKSAVADLFEQTGIPVLRADTIAKELMTSDKEMMAQIRRAFGDQAYTDGTLNRSYLASEIFNDRSKLETMNAIVHPRTIAEQGVRARRLVSAGHRVVVCETALIFEGGGEGRFDYIVVVDANPELRMKRASERDGVPIEDVRKRDAAQLPAQQKVESADFVIRNDGTMEELKKNTMFIAMLLKSLPPRHTIETEDEPEDSDELDD